MTSSSCASEAADFQAVQERGGAVAAAVLALRSATGANRSVLLWNKGGNRVIAPSVVIGRFRRGRARLIFQRCRYRALLSLRILQK